MGKNLNGRYALANDIGDSIEHEWNGGKGFAPIGNKSNPLAGVFNIRGYKIIGLYIDQQFEDYVGLVGYNGGTVSNCYSTGSVSGDNCVGGLVAWNYDGTIIASF